MGLDNPDPNEPKCCFCFPLKCGILLIGFMCFIDLLYEISRTALTMSFSVAMGIFSIPSVLFMITSCLIFAKYCWRDTETNRMHNCHACGLMVFANTLILIIWIFGAIFHEQIKGAAAI